jgi:hypothetical protein
MYGQSIENMAKVTPSLIVILKGDVHSPHFEGEHGRVEVPLALLSQMHVARLSCAGWGVCATCPSSSADRGV